MGAGEDPRSGPLLLCFDGTEASHAGLRAAARLLAPRPAVVATAWQPAGALAFEDASAPAQAALAQLDGVRVRRAEAIAAQGCAIAAELGFPAEPRAIAALAGVAEALDDLARELGACAVVTGGRLAAARHPLLLGSVSRGVAHRADRPVAMMRGEGEDPADGPVLLAYDGSDASRHAVEAAAGLLGGGPARVVHAWLAPSHVMLWNPFLRGPGPLAEPAELLDESSAEGARRLAAEGAQLARAAGFDAEPAAVPIARRAWRTLVRAAAEARARLVVVGTHGWSPLDVALGSVADRIVTHADRPVLLVPAPPGSGAEGRAA